MRKCSEPECTSFTSEGLCYYHSKLKAGLMASGLTEPERRIGTFDDYLRRYPDPREASMVRHWVLESGVLDDEQEQIADVLHRLGADQLHIKRALTRTERKRRRHLAGADR